MGWTHYLLFSKNSLKLFQWFSSTPWLMLIAMYHFVRITKEKFDVQIWIYNGLFFVNNKVIFFRTLRTIHLPLGFSTHLSAYLSAYAGWAPLNKDLNHTRTSSQHWRVTHKLSWHVIWNLTHKAPWDYIVTKSPTVCTKNVVAYQYSYFKLPYVCCNVIFLVMSAPSAASV